MKKLAAPFFAAACLMTAAPAKAESYALDSSHTSITWSVSHFGFSHPDGKFSQVEGALELDEQHPEKSSLKVTVYPGTVITGVSKLDAVLQSKEWFDVEKYRTAVFESDKVTRIGKDAARVHGNLTLHGVTRPLSLNVKLNKLGLNPITRKKTAGFTASTVIKRSDFGMTAFIPNVGDDVTVAIESEANVTDK